MTRTDTPTQRDPQAFEAAHRALLETALEPVQADLGAVTERVLAVLDDPVARKVVYLITAGGKRLRPALVLLAGRRGMARHRAALIDGAAAVELIHTATLIHDDIIDGSQVRRAQPAFHEQWGTERAVLMGDYLYASAFTLLSRLEAPEVVRILSDVCRALCRGELREVEARFRLDLTESEYVEIIGDKTASLTAGCCESGARLGGVPAASVAACRTFGWEFGVAFQIIDDCLDLCGDPAQLGKPVLSDLDQGVLSLPIIYLMESLGAGERARVFADLPRRAEDPAFRREIAEAARASGALARAEATALSHIRRAESAVAGAAGTGLAEAWGGLGLFAVERRA